MGKKSGGKKSGVKRRGVKGRGVKSRTPVKTAISFVFKANYQGILISSRREGS